MQTKSVSKKKKSKHRSGSKTSWLLCALALVASFYVVFMIVEQHISINKANAELAQLEEKIFAQEQVNAELKKVADAVDNENEENRDDEAFASYVERIAREELDYVKNGEVVYVNIAGD